MIMEQATLGMETDEMKRLWLLLQVKPKQIAAMMATGLMFYSEGRLPDAEKVFESLLSLDCQNPYIHGMLGAIQKKQGKFADALIRYTQALSIQSEDIHCRINRGEIYLRLGHLREAIDDFKTAILLDPDKKHPSANCARLIIGLLEEALKLRGKQN